VNWNGEKLLNKCIDSLRRQTYENFEIIVVDNASADGSIRLLQQLIPEAKLIKLTDNMGFTGGNIEGLKEASGDYIALLNNDAFPDRNWLYELVSAMDEDDKVGICASKLAIFSQPDRIDSAGEGCVTSVYGYKRGNNEVMNDCHTEKEYIFGASAAAALYKKEMIEDIGFFDEDFFLNCEDTDLSFRAQLMGWKCLYVPTALVLHGVHTTIGALSDQSVYYSARNHEFVWIKNMPTALIFYYLFHRIIQELGFFIYFCVKHGKWISFLMGKLNALKMFPVLLRKRREIQRERRVSNRYVKYILTSIYEKKLVKAKLRKLLSLI
jgi:GT2 family glycosyltransferase